MGACEDSSALVNFKSFILADIVISLTVDKPFVLLIEPVGDCEAVYYTSNSSLAMFAR